MDTLNIYQESNIAPVIPKPNKLGKLGTGAGGDGS